MARSATCWSTSPDERRRTRHSPRRPRAMFDSFGSSPSAAVSDTASPHKRPQKRPHQIFEAANCSEECTSESLPSLPWAQGVAGSNPVAPTTFLKNLHKHNGHGHLTRWLSAEVRCRHSPQIADFCIGLGPNLGSGFATSPIAYHLAFIHLCRSTARRVPRLPPATRPAAREAARLDHPSRGSGAAGGRSARPSVRRSVSVSRSAAKLLATRLR